MITARPIKDPITVCTAKSCVDYMRFSPDPNSPMETVYKTHCHAECYLQGVEVERVPNPALQNCAALHGNINKCKKCGCPWTTHMHIKYKLEKNPTKVRGR